MFIAGLRNCVEKRTHEECQFYVTTIYHIEAIIIIIIIIACVTYYIIVYQLVVIDDDGIL